jgi:type III pantothenate kinase
MRTLAVCIGNTSLFVGVFTDERLMTSFRLLPTELLRLPGRVRGAVDRAVFCSVVPALTPGVLKLIRRTWKVEAEPLDALSPHGLQIGYRRPAELGADRVAAALGAREIFPRQNVVITDGGTATTVTALRGDGTLLGGLIFPGITLWPEILARRTAQLPEIPLGRSGVALGRSTREGLVSGIFIGYVGAIRETVARVRVEAFGTEAAVVVGTGGLTPLFARENLFTLIEPALVLRGLRGFAARADAA